MDPEELEIHKKAMEYVYQPKTEIFDLMLTYFGLPHVRSDHPETEEEEELAYNLFEEMSLFEPS